MPLFVFYRRVLMRSDFLISRTFRNVGCSSKAICNLFHRRRVLCTSSKHAEKVDGSAKGEAKKKSVSGAYASAYNPKEVEKGWYEYWEKAGFFKPEFYDKHVQKGESQSVFSMVLPPPNVTGNLHLGHTLTVAIEDAICRWHRMKGRRVLWVPGYDHGGIATQAVVEKMLFKEKKLSRHQIGKQRFLEETLEWKDRTQKTIEQQLKKLGSSLDFSRSLFTLDPHTTNAVLNAFIQLFDENLIYRKEKMVNWSCAMRSVISDIEVDHLDVPANGKLRVPGLLEPIDVGILEFFSYPLYDSAKEKVSVATTRLETMLGDTALAVNPTDERHSHLIGRFAKHPFTGNKIPIVGDDVVNKAFGTGVVKVTPGHDFKDHDLGQRHGLPIIEVLTDEGTIRTEIKMFSGKHRFEARKLVREQLVARGLYIEKKGYPMRIPVCSRTGDIVEPRLKAQWYLDCQQMGQEALKAVNEGRLKLIPEYNEKVWSEWFHKLQDWCISRQLWWGHQIPVYRIHHPSLSQGKQVWVAARNFDEAVKKASVKLNRHESEITAIPDEDVLDTWFSSAVFPLTALGWPERAEDMEKFFPLTLMETGYDIMFFWVSRMVMLGQYLTGKLPFSEVLLHGMICDSHGRKMTKSLGNIIDPSDIIYGTSLENLCERAEESFRKGSLSPEELKMALNSYRRSYPTGIPECGTDALRFSLLAHNVQDQRINIDVKEIRISRHFCNKIWQGVRFFLKAIENCISHDALSALPSQETALSEMGDMEQWILSRLSKMVTNCNQGFESYDFHIATQACRQFWVQNFCDIYVEYAKTVLVSGDENTCILVCRVMLTCIETFLRCIAPIMPFIAEELYQRLSEVTHIRPVPSICIANYPDSESYAVWRNTVLEADVHTVMDLVNVARSLKTQHGVTKMRPKVTVAVCEENTLNALSRFATVIAALARLDSVTFHLTQGQEFFESQVQDSWVFQEHEHGITVIMEMEGLSESGKISENKVEDIRQELERLSKLLSDSGYRKKAPLSVQEKHLAKKASLEAELQKLLPQYSKPDTDVKEDTSLSESRS